MKLAMLFPGYGSQHVGMGKDLYDEYPVVKKYIDEASDYLGVDFNELLFSSSPQELLPVSNAYLALYVLSCAIYGMLKEHGVEPTYVAGYDTGQYAAIYAAGGISFKEGLDLVRAYANLYNKLLQQSRYDILKVNGLTTNKLSEFIDKDVAIASHLSRTQHLVSGTVEGIEILKQKINNASGVTLYEEGIGLGLNSHLMDPLIRDFYLHLSHVNFNDLQVPLISNVNGSEITNASQLKQEIISLINSTIRWDKVADKLSHVDIVVGMGPQTNLLDWINEKHPNKNIFTISDATDSQKLKELMATIE